MAQSFNRRDFLKSSCVATAGLSLFGAGWVAAADGRKPRILYFTRSAGFEHDAVKRQNGRLAFSEQILTDLGKKHGFDIVATKDGRVFDEDLSQWDAVALYATGNWHQPKEGQGNPVSREGKDRFLKAVEAGLPVIGLHAASDAFRSNGIDPYIAMIGGEFISHGPQQVAKVTVADAAFPGVGPWDQLEMNEEWYANGKFPKDLHVVLVQQTEGMKGDCYKRAPFPQTWTRMHGKGRVFYTSFGHREDVLTNPDVQNLILGGIAWSLGNIQTHLEPNMDQVCPDANKY